MHLKKSFSIIELMTVILVILLLMTLIIPTFAKAKMNARTAICKNQMRQIGVLINSYMSDYGGYLPYKNANGSYSSDGGKSDIPKPTVGNNELYRNWNGHLLPYLDVYLPNKYTRYAMVTKIGSTRYPGQLGSGVQNGPPANPLANGWVVVDDAFHKGGYNDLKVFICPEIHQNTVDVKALITYNGVRIPRISQLCNEGFQDQAGYDYGMNGGIPTTYMANAIFFGLRGNVNSYRVDNIAEISKKALVIEGGCAMIDGGGGDPYYHIDWSWYYYPAANNGSDLASTSRIDKAGFRQKTSYVHDNYENFWVMKGFYPNQGYSFELAAKFNVRFAGKAEMVAGDGNWWNLDFAIVSFVDPIDSAGVCIYKNFLKANAPTAALNPFTPFIDDPNEYRYLTGNMNVLFGDGAVDTKSQGWLCNNRQKVALPSNE